MSTLDTEKTSEEDGKSKNNADPEKDLIQNLLQSIAEHQKRLKKSLPKVDEVDCHD